MYDQSTMCCLDDCHVQTMACVICNVQIKGRVVVAILEKCNFVAAEYVTMYSVYKHVVEAGEEFFRNGSSIALRVLYAFQHSIFLFHILLSSPPRVNSDDLFRVEGGVMGLPLACTFREAPGGLPVSGGVEATVDPRLDGAGGRDTNLQLISGGGGSSVEAAGASRGTTGAPG